MTIYCKIYCRKHVNETYKRHTSNYLDAKVFQI